MSIENHINALREKHAHLQSIIDREESRPLPDRLLVQNLKRQKLSIKDKIAAIPSAEIAPFPEPSPVSTIPLEECPLQKVG